VSAVRETYMMDFTREEYVARKEKLVRLMQESGLGGILLSTKENVRYFTGFQSIVWDSKISTPAFIVANSEGDWRMIGSQSSVGTMSITSWLPEEETLFYQRGAAPGGKPSTLLDAICQTVERLGLAGRKVGMETGIGFRPHLTFPVLKGLLGFLEDKGCQVEDAAGLLWNIRSIKSPREIAYFREACRLNCLLYEKAFGSVVPGVTSERDLMRVMGMEAFRLGCDNILDMGIRSGLDRDPHTNCPSSDRVIGSRHEREVLMIDGGPSYKGYYSDIIRTAVIGQPSKKQLEYHQIAVDACYTGLAKLKPGEPLADAVKAVDDFLDQRGMTPINRTLHWIGHGIGLDFHEYPCLELGTDAVAQPGMCFACEPCICDGNGMFGIEQNVVITNDGYELLTPFRHDLVVIS